MPLYFPPASGSGDVATDAIWDAAGDVAVGSGSNTAARLAAGTLGTRLQFNGSTLAWVPHVVRRASDATAINADDTLGNDDTLLWAIGANEVWYFQAWIIATAANSTADIKMGVSVPASATALWGSLATAGAAGVSGYGSIASGSTPGVLQTESGSVTYGTGSGSFGYHIAGTVINSTNAGNVNLQFAQGTSNVSDLVIKANSILLLWRLA